MLQIPQFALLYDLPLTLLANVIFDLLCCDRYLCGIPLKGKTYGSPGPGRFPPRRVRYGWSTSLVGAGETTAGETTSVETTGGATSVETTSADATSAGASSVETTSADATSAGVTTAGITCSILPYPLTE